MAPFRKGYVDTSFGQIHYREAGEGAPLVLLHQTPSSSAMWDPVLPLFGEAGYRCVAFDMLGFGNSAMPESKPAGREYAQAMVEAAQALGIQQADVLGHHTGVTVAMIQADEFPDTVRKLVLWGIPLLPAAALDRLRNEGPSTYGEEGAELTRFWVNRRRMSRPEASTELSIRWMIERLQMGLNTHWAHNMVGETDHVTLLKRLRQPILLMCGQLDTSTWQATLDAKALRPELPFVAIENSSLDVADEYPGAFVRAVHGFLSEQLPDWA
ncbi:MAG: alpha/beta hydrolase [Dehalococcoidia bacterium]